jgi:nitrite reductase/ring-hydroxylating ferredoxin subunit
MDLPLSVAALEAQLDGDTEFLPDPELFHSPQVFAAERERIFSRSPIAIDHRSRLAEAGRYLRFDTAGRSLLLTRAADGALHALRNLCLHAGYPVCDAEEGAGERVICRYHGWEYALDGQLVEPALSARIDPARLRLKRYPVEVLSGLIVVDLDGAGGSSRRAHGTLPAWLADATVSRRLRWSTTSNWKIALQFVKGSPRRFLDEAGACLGWREIGPLSLILTGCHRAALLQVIPKCAGHTDLRLIEMTAPGALPAAAAVADRVDEGLRRVAAEPAPQRLDRAFVAWYWSLMSAV